MRSFIKSVLGALAFLIGAALACLVTAVCLDNSSSDYRRYITLRRGESKDESEKD
ncbi:MAG: hypothetical protein Q4B42_06155 [Oscillospiraceae bacterium]|nr:hypothetical protein [Oscillospiraceae bacterium]